MTGSHPSFGMAGTSSHGATGSIMVGQGCATYRRLGNASGVRVWSGRNGHASQARCARLGRVR